MLKPRFLQETDHTDEGDMADEYIRGQMDISEHKSTFNGVMNVSTYASLVTAVVVLYLALVFGASTDWLVALGVSLAVGGLGGYLTKRGAMYWVSLAVLAVITLIAGFVTSLLVG